MAFPVELPAGGSVRLHSADEVDLWTKSHRKYMEDFHLRKTNDLVLLGAILQQQIVLYRAQRRINGEEPVIDATGAPTGAYQQVAVESDAMHAALVLITKASDQIMKIEKALGIDKVARESGGAHNVADYITTLKRAAHTRGLMISHRVRKQEEFFNELKWRVRVLLNADSEDRAYHDLTYEKVCRWADEQMCAIEAAEKSWSKERGKLFVGKL